ncbi:MAG: hypothetical protein ABIF17_00210 [Patescibacteria group bacterium]
MLNKIKEPKNTEKYFWTEHVKAKLKQYGLSSGRVVRVLRHPERHEEAIVSHCFACMQPAGNKKKTEIWVMYQLVCKSEQTKYKIQTTKFKNNVIKIITAWRYPCRTKPGAPVPLPEDIYNQIMSEVK